MLALLMKRCVTSDCSGTDSPLASRDGQRHTSHSRTLGEVGDRVRPIAARCGSSRARSDRRRAKRTPHLILATSDVGCREGREGRPVRVRRDGQDRLRVGQRGQDVCHLAARVLDSDRGRPRRCRPRSTCRPDRPAHVLEAFLAAAARAALTSAMTGKSRRCRRRIASELEDAKSSDPLPAISPASRSFAPTNTCWQGSSGVSIATVGRSP